MNTGRRIIAAAEVILIFPAALFMVALAVRGWRVPEQEPTHAAAHIVKWYTVRSWTFPVLLVRLPSVVLLSGCATLLWSWHSDRSSRKAAPQSVAPFHVDPATLVIAATTLVAAYILAVIAMHALVN